MGESLFAELGNRQTALSIQHGLALFFVQADKSLETFYRLIVVLVVKFQFAKADPCRREEVAFSINNCTVVSLRLITILTFWFANQLHFIAVDVRHQVAQHQVRLQKAVVLRQCLLKAVHRRIVLALVQSLHSLLI